VSQPTSACCGAPIRLSVADEGTAHYRCTRCDNPCDVALTGPTVYVDQFPARGWGKWNGGAHMLANDLDALHAMAARLGLRRAWFQSSSRFAHYDLTASRRALAVRFGAVEIEMGEIPDDVLMRCEDGSYERRSDRLARRDSQRAAPRPDPGAAG
jgi:hypothetical protein